MKSREFAGLEKALGHRFRRRELLLSALTHTSHAHEVATRNGDAAEPEGESDNERLEYLGDAVLALVASEELWHRYPAFKEGQLSKLRAHLVSQNHLVGVAEELELGRYLRLGRGEEKSGGRKKAALLTDALEALIGAMYLDAGLEKPRAFVLKRIVLPELERAAEDESLLPVSDYKSALQERAHVLGRAQPSYVLVNEEGPQHQKIFTVEARLHRIGKRKAEYVAKASGATKKAAEQSAAREALNYLNSVSKEAVSGS
jgi:ribonuclease-3